MKKSFLLIFLVPGIILYLIHRYWLPLNSQSLQYFYVEHLQSSLFSAFLTLGGILYSLKTFIIVEFKKNVYDTEPYEHRVDKLRKINPHITRYGPLKRLSDLLFYSVIGSLISAITQFTIGFISAWWAALIAIYIAASVLLLFIVSLTEIRLNLNDWFEFLEENDRKRHDQFNKKKL